MPPITHHAARLTPPKSSPSPFLVNCSHSYIIPKLAVIMSAAAIACASACCSLEKFFLNAKGSAPSPVATAVIVA